MIMFMVKSVSVHSGLINKFLELKVFPLCLVLCLKKKVKLFIAIENQFNVLGILLFRIIRDKLRDLLFAFLLL